MGKIQNLYYKLKFNYYLKKHPNQLKSMDLFEKMPNCVLVISNTALGDTILSTSALKSLKESFPNTKVILLVHYKLENLFKNFPYVDELVLYRGGYKNFSNIIKNIRIFMPKMSLIFHGNGPQDIQISVMSGCEYILKHPTSSPLKKYLSYDFKYKLQHTIEDRLQILKMCKATILNKKLCLPLDKNEQISNKINTLVDNSKTIVGLQLGAADGYKMWPIENFIAFSKELLDNDDNLNIVVTGIESESYLAQQIVKTLGHRVINLCSACSIEELPYLIKRFSVLVTNDTGTMHLAIALDVPTISLFSTTNSVISGPYHDFNIHKVIQKDGLNVQSITKKIRTNENMKLILVKEVVDTYNKLKATLNV